MEKLNGKTKETFFMYIFAYRGTCSFRIVRTEHNYARNKTQRDSECRNRL